MNIPRLGKCETAVIAAPFGSLAVYADGEFLLDIELKPSPFGLIDPATPLLRQAALEFKAYFNDPTWRFSIRLPDIGTAYQRRVWQAMSAIPPGQAKTYGHLAAQLESSPRAVAGACRANRFPIIIPCHRIVGSKGLGGYCGDVDGPNIDIKRWLLRHEGHEFP